MKKKIIIVNPKNGTDKTYLYNVILRKVKEEDRITVNHLADVDDKVIQILDKRGIQYFPIENGSIDVQTIRESNTITNNELIEKLVKLMIKGRIDSSEFGIEFSDEELDVIKEVAKKVMG